MHFWIFSYNRGEFLRNCIESIERCAPQCPITVFDDGSDDAATQKVLRDLAVKHSVIYPSQRDPSSESKHGGLYSNMQAAYERLAGEETVFFLQDDTQLVRAVSDKEIAAISQYFDKDKKIGFIHPAFIRGRNKRRDHSRTRFDESLGAYFVDRFNRSAGTYYSDIFIAKVANLKAVDWQFLGRESHNEQQARSKLKQMPYLKNPFAVWLPYPPAYRGKALTFVFRITQKLRVCGFYPVRYMSAEQTQKFVTRDPTQIPYAEDFLEVDRVSVPKPWSYYPLQGGGVFRILKFMNNIELVIRKRLEH